MNINSLLKLVGNDPVFESSLFFVGDIDPKIVRLQLSRWVKSGRIYQLRRGLYAIAPPFQKISPHPFLVANHLNRSSYVSLQSALAFYNLIPETVNRTISVTTGRPERLDTQLGGFEFRHIKSSLLTGYKMLNLGGQSALVATPEKALLDLVYLQPGGDSPLFLQELRLQNVEILDMNKLEQLSIVYDSQKIQSAVMSICKLIRNMEGEYENL